MKIFVRALRLKSTGKFGAAGAAHGPRSGWATGHRDFKTTLIYADYQPAAEEAALVEKAFSGPNTESARGHPVGRHSSRR